MLKELCGLYHLYLYIFIIIIINIMIFIVTITRYYHRLYQHHPLHYKSSLVIVAVTITAVVVIGRVQCYHDKTPLRISIPMSTEQTNKSSSITKGTDEDL